MNRIVLFIFVTLAAVGAQAQIHEFGVFAGGANYIGDVGPTTYVAPRDLALGVIYKWNRSPRHSWRVGFTYANISSDDADADSPGRVQRGFKAENTIKELSAGLEFNFFDFNLHESDPKLTPYVYTGISYFWYDEMYIEPNGEVNRGSATGSLAVPMIVGLKTNVIDSFVIGFEIGARYSFTDDIDGSNHPDYQQFAFGDLESNDWYVFTGFTLTYTFGNKPCYCSN